MYMYCRDSSILWGTLLLSLLSSTTPIAGVTGPRPAKRSPKQGHARWCTTGSPVLEVVLRGLEPVIASVISVQPKRVKSRVPKSKRRFRWDVHVLSGFQYTIGNLLLSLLSSTIPIAGVTASRPAKRSPKQVNRVD